MKKCTNCHVSVDPSHTTCPLCHRNLASVDTLKVNPWYPPYTDEPDAYQGKFLTKLFAYIVFSIIVTCTVINLLAGTTTLWFLYVIPCTLYSWLLVEHTLLSTAHLGSKIVFQALGLSGLLFWLNLLTSDQHWAASYVFPFLVIGATFLMTLIIISKKMQWSDFVGYLITMILIGLLPLLLHVLGISNVLWTAAAASLYAILTFSGMMIFSDKTFKNEVIRRFHF